MPAEVVRTVVDESGVQELLTSEEMRDMLMRFAEPIVDRARRFAPKRSGFGAGSIRSEPFLVEGVQTVRISWEREFYYMYFQNEGTVTVPEVAFLERAVEGEGL